MSFEANLFSTVLCSLGIFDTSSPAWRRSWACCRFACRACLGSSSLILILSLRRGMVVRTWKVRGVLITWVRWQGRLLDQFLCCSLRVKWFPPQCMAPAGSASIVMTLHLHFKFLRLVLECSVLNSLAVWFQSCQVQLLLIEGMSLLKEVDAFLQLAILPLLTLNLLVEVRLAWVAKSVLEEIVHLWDLAIHHVDHLVHVGFELFLVVRLLSGSDGDLLVEIFDNYDELLNLLLLLCNASIFEFDLTLSKLQISCHLLMLGLIDYSLLQFLYLEL